MMDNDEDYLADGVCDDDVYMQEVPWGPPGTTPHGLEEPQRDPWETALQDFPVGTCTSGEVVYIADYGAFVELSPGLMGLLHNSELSWTDKEACAQNMLALGDRVDVVVIDVNPKKKRIRLSHRRTTPNPWDGVEERFPVGARIRGWVHDMSSFGAFVTIDDGLDGLLHISEMSWTKTVSRPEEFLKKGQTIDVIVLRVDAQKRRISLGHKQTVPDPFDDIAQRYPVGTIVRGKVVMIRSKLGAFVEFEHGVDGMIHITQISERRIDNVGAVLRVGQEVEARVIKVSRNKKGNCLVGLSMRKPPEKGTPQERRLTDAPATIVPNPGGNLV